MQAVCSTSATAFKGVSLPRRASRTGVTAARPVLAARIACKAEANLAKKVAAASVAIPAFVAAHPAFALVDSRLNGDGTGKALGIDAGIEAIALLGVFTLVDSRLNGDGTGKALGVATGAEGFAILGVFTLIWVLFYIATKDVGEGRGSGDDSGLTL